MRFRKVVVILSFFVFGVILLGLMFQTRWLQPPRRGPLTDQELITLGKPSLLHADLIEQIAKDINFKNNIRLILSPDVVTKGRLVSYRSDYYILVQKEYFLTLSDMEQRALIGHELGHIIFRGPPLCSPVIHCQIKADLFAAKYTSPEIMINLLNKISADPFWITSDEYLTRLEFLKLLSYCRKNEFPLLF